MWRVGARLAGSGCRASAGCAGRLPGVLIITTGAESSAWHYREPAMSFHTAGLENRDTQRALLAERRRLPQRGERKPGDAQ